MSPDFIPGRQIPLWLIISRSSVPPPVGSLVKSSHFVAPTSNESGGTRSSQRKSCSSVCRSAAPNRVTMPVAIWTSVGVPFWRTSRIRSVICFTSGSSARAGSRRVKRSTFTEGRSWPRCREGLPRAAWNTIGRDAALRPLEGPEIGPLGHELGLGAAEQEVGRGQVERGLVGPVSPRLAAFGGVPGAVPFDDAEELRPCVSPGPHDRAARSAACPLPGQDLHMNAGTAGQVESSSSRSPPASPGVRGWHAPAPARDADVRRSIPGVLGRCDHGASEEPGPAEGVRSCAARHGISWLLCRRICDGPDDRRVTSSPFADLSSSPHRAVPVASSNRSSLPMGIVFTSLASRSSDVRSITRIRLLSKVRK